MGINDSKVYLWWKEYGKHIEAFLIITLLITLIIIYDKNNKLQEKINEKCGWGEENYYCFCEKSIVNQLENKVRHNLSINISGGLNHVYMVR